jgi:hypothetical protein
MHHCTYGVEITVCPLSKGVWTTSAKTLFKFYTLLLTAALWKEAIAPNNGIML